MGERAGRREQMAKFEQTMIRDGVDHRVAREKVRELAIRADRRQDENVNPQRARLQRAADEARERAERLARDG